MIPWEGLAIKTIFVQGPVPGFRLVLVMLVSAALIAADTRFEQLTAPVRSTLATGLAPVHWLGHAPYRFTDWVSELLVTRGDLEEQNEELKTRLLILERRALKYAALAAENNELRRLLNSSETVDERVVISEVVGVSPDPFSHEIIINRGANDGLEPGQAVLDSQGLMGQITRTSQFTSRVLLISDSSHAVPVEVVRNGLRYVLLGNGERDYLELMHVPDTADIREGDMLVSSGLGGRFPRGYPVAEVSRISQEPGEPFVSIQAEPKARLNQSRLVLVVFLADSEDSINPDNQPLAEPESAGESN